jgi:hypothetical protein
MILVDEAMIASSRAQIDLLKGEWHALVELEGGHITDEMQSDEAVLTWALRNPTAGMAFHHRTKKGRAAEKRAAYRKSVEGKGGSSAVKLGGFK